MNILPKVRFSALVKKIGSISSYLFLLAFLMAQGALPLFSDKSGANLASKRSRLLAYFRSLPSRNCQRVLSGQHIGSYPAASEGYRTYIIDLQARTGKIPAILGCDLHNRTSANQEEVHAILKDHWRRNGLVAISWHACNPWTGGDSRDKRGARLAELLDESSGAHRAWLAMVDEVAAALKDLAAAGVIVMWRPFHEMNGGWFWWGIKSQGNSPDSFIALWRWLHRYMEEHHRLRNLIWVYSVSPPADPGWAVPFERHYPGDDMVDMIGIDVYSDHLVIGGYERLLAWQKPVGLSEFGPREQRNGGYANDETIRVIRQMYPQIVYWIQYRDWRSSRGGMVRKSIVGNPKARELLADPWVITREEVNWRGE